MIEEIITISREAGTAIMQVYNGEKPLDLNKKQDDSPVTAADLASHRIIVMGLQALTPDIPLLSEEELPDWSVRKHWRRFWLVDPLDGTQGFLIYNGEFTVNIALIDNGKPVIGVVYVPVSNKIYAAAYGKAWCINESGEEQAIEVKKAYPPLVVVSRSQGNNVDLQDYLVSLGKHQIITIGSSLKFCLIAEGTAQLYPRFGLTNVWDTAAGHLVAMVAGAQVKDWKGRNLDYIPRKSFFNPSFHVSLF